MKSIFLLAGLVIGACAMQACENAKRNSNDPDSLATTMIDSAEMAMTDSMSRYQDDQASFIQQAALGSMMEVELGNLAKEQAANEKVKAFAAMVVRDHNKINAALKTLAASREVNLPSTIAKKEEAHLEAMKKMKGDAFDQHYMSMMVEDHVKAIDLYKLASRNSDMPISKFATKTLPILEAHHQEASTIQSTLK